MCFKKTVSIIVVLSLVFSSCGNRKNPLRRDEFVNVHYSIGDIQGQFTANAGKPIESVEGIKCETKNNTLECTTQDGKVVYSSYGTKIVMNFVFNSGESVAFDDFIFGKTLPMMPNKLKDMKYEVQLREATTTETANMAKNLINARENYEKNCVPSLFRKKKMSDEKCKSFFEKYMDKVAKIENIPVMKEVADAEAELEDARYNEAKCVKTLKNGKCVAEKKHRKDAQDKKDAAEEKKEIFISRVNTHVPGFVASMKIIEKDIKNNKYDYVSIKKWSTIEDFGVYLLPGMQYSTRWLLRVFEYTGIFENKKRWRKGLPVLFSNMIMTGFFTALSAAIVYATVRPSDYPIYTVLAKALIVPVIATTSVLHNSNSSDTVSELNEKVSVLNGLIVEVLMALDIASAGWSSISNHNQYGKWKRPKTEIYRQWHRKNWKTMSQFDAQHREKVYSGMFETKLKPSLVSITKDMLDTSDRMAETVKKMRNEVDLIKTASQHTDRVMHSDNIKTLLGTMELYKKTMHTNATYGAENVMHGEEYTKNNRTNRKWVQNQKSLINKSIKVLKEASATVERMSKNAIQVVQEI